mgnify:CR=1 FL=1
MLKRKIDNYLIDWKNKPDKKPLIVKGARQVGKSFIIRKVAKELFKNAITYNTVIEEIVNQVEYIIDSQK